MPCALFPKAHAHRLIATLTYSHDNPIASCTGILLLDDNTVGAGFVTLPLRKHATKVQRAETPTIKVSPY